MFDYSSFKPRILTPSPHFHSHFTNTSPPHSAHIPERTPTHALTTLLLVSSSFSSSPSSSICCAASYWQSQLLASRLRAICPTLVGFAINLQNMQIKINNSQQVIEYGFCSVKTLVQKTQVYILLTANFSKLILKCAKKPYPQIVLLITSVYNQ